MKRFSIRFKMWAIFANLLLLAFILAGAGLYAVRLYKNMVRDVAWRANVLPVAGRMGGYVGELRTVLGELRGIRRSRVRLPLEFGEDRMLLEGRFQKSLFEIRQSYNDYRHFLEDRVGEEEREEEFETLHKIRRSLKNLDDAVALKDWGATDKTLEAIDLELANLQQLAGELPDRLHDNLLGYSESMKRQSRWLNAIMICCLAFSAVQMFLLMQLSYLWIFKPLGILISGSRKVADGTFQYRIEISSRDEMAELAEAMNRMTERFESIRKDLDLKVQQRSRELIRSERLASVGFLAAGVAHEINNPLAAISTCAESLQKRVVPLLEKCARDEEETATARRYLKMIEEEAFRCKGITEKLLSFSRSENKERERTDLAVLITDIVEMTRQHDDYKRKEIRLDLPESLEMTANAQEMKQVVLNLLTNALNNTDKNGCVTIRLRREADAAEESDRVVLAVSDDGCGMDQATLKNIFEPFFTLRRHGQGTGLGLSITHRIVEDHNGRIEVFSDGSDRGSTFLVNLPVE